jgi:hypothetical protein
LFASVLDEHFGPVLEEFDLAFEDLEDLLGPQLPWTCWGAAFEDFMTRHWDPEGNAVDIYLKRRGWREPALAKSYMQGLRDAHVSLHEVVATDPGTGMVLRDLLTGADPVAVREKSASKSLQPGDRIAVRVVSVRDHHVISGGLLPFAPAVVELLMDGLRTTLKLRRKKDPRFTPDQLRRMGPLFTAAFLFTHIPDALDPDAPQMTNTNGETLVFHELRFPFAAGVTQAHVAEALGHMPDLSADGAKRWVWLSRPRKAGTAVPEGGTVHGMLEMRGRALVLAVNSAERAARGTAMIRKATGALLRPPLTAIQTFEQARAAHAANAPAPQDDIPPDVARAVIHAHMDRHYRDTLDQPIPALKGKTPRQAVQTAAGRKRVTEWLRLLESGSAGPEAGPMAGYDFGWIWTELGLTRDG